uniref:Uncharacterized protein n=1 Tax=Arundo donax TaxID=35708 RepID=A0A0A9DD32_ARUDO
MAAHRLPRRAWARRMAASSSAVNGRRSTCGDSWLHHRRRHDFPDRPGISRPIAVQFRAPCRSTSRRSASSSSGLHGPLIRSHSASAPIAEDRSKKKKRQTTTTTSSRLRREVAAVVSGGGQRRFGSLWFSVYSRVAVGE